MKKIARSPRLILTKPRFQKYPVPGAGWPRLLVIFVDREHLAGADLCGRLTKGSWMAARSWTGSARRDVR